MELIADELAKYQNELEPNIAEFADALHAELMDRYHEAVSVLEDHTFPIVQCILSRQQIRLQDVITGSDLQWEHVAASGLIWFERTTTNYGTRGYLVAPYIWLWMLARLPAENAASENAMRICRFLRDWQFNDYAELPSPCNRQRIPRKYWLAKLRGILLLISHFAVAGIWRWTAGAVEVLALRLQIAR
jgi:hypothetical protein